MSVALLKILKLHHGLDVLQLSRQNGASVVDTNIFNMFYLISKKQNEILKNTQFCMENLKMKRKKDQKILTFPSGFSVIFPPMIWIFMESEEPEIKSKQASKKVRTLPLIHPDFVNNSLGNFHWNCMVAVHIIVL